MSNIESLLNNIKLGDVLLFKTSGFYASLVKLFTKSDYTHSALYIGGGVIIESDFGGVQINLLTHKYKDVPMSIYRHNTANEFELRNVRNWAITQIGKGYDYLGILGIVYHGSMGDKHNSFDMADRYWCHEFVMDAYINAGLKVDIEKDTYLVNPSDIVKDNNFKCMIDKEVFL